MNLHESPDDFQALIIATAEKFKIRQVYVEKDYWVTFILKRLSSSAFTSEVVFKGGTSLSKAFRIIDRFSEDVDLAVIRNSRSDGQVKEQIRKIEKALTQPPFIEVEDDRITSKRGLNRQTLHSYPRLGSNSDFGPARPEILLEINCFGEPFPAEQKSIRSFITEYLVVTDQASFLEEFELTDFDVQVLDIRQTFLEKVLSIAYASLDDGPEGTKNLGDRIRHFYDLTLLYREPTIQSLLNSKRFTQLLQKTRSEETLPTRTKWAGIHLAECPLFSAGKKIMTALEPIYSGDFTGMVFHPEVMPEYSEVKKCVLAISKAITNEQLSK